MPNVANEVALTSFASSFFFVFFPFFFCLRHPFYLWFPLQHYTNHWLLSLFNDINY